MSGSTLVEREEVPVAYVRSEDMAAAIRAAWDELETAVGSLHRRKFYGAFYPVTEEYRACVELGPGEQPPAGLKTDTLPGGRFLRLRLSGEPPALYERIRPGFEELLTQGKADMERPSLEFYRRFDEVDLLLPVR